jgi:hypothetical protein
MHDDPIERRLRAALRREAEALPFTITSAELERRVALRSRRSAGRRSTYLLAAAVGIGLLGVGGVVGGLLGDVTESQPPSQVADTTPPIPSGPIRLGTLNEFVAGSIGDEVVIAHAYEPIDVTGVDPEALRAEARVSLGTIAGSTRYQLTFVCEGSGKADFTIVAVPPVGSARSITEVECDAAVYSQQIHADGPQVVFLSAPRESSWRIVVRRLDGTDPGFPMEPSFIELPPGQQELVRAELQSTTANGRRWVDSGLVVEEIGSVPARTGYEARIWCAGGDDVRLILGDDLEGTTVPNIETAVPCDSRIHDPGFAIPMPFGSRVFVAAAPESRWSILVGAEVPPIGLANDQPGWQRQVGFGPHLSFDSTEHGFSAPGVDGGGPVLIVIACAGNADIEVTVDAGRELDERQETLIAACTPEGAETSQSFELDGSTVHLTLAEPIGTWTAISILVPDPIPEEG